jgi:hypothetical protein
LGFFFEIMVGFLKKISCGVQRTATFMQISEE